jgi:pyridoxamine 5'-phosphate oxidase
VSDAPIPAEVLHRFAEAMERAKRTDLPEPTAVVLATADASGRPSSRAVLLKGFDESGFVFYTNLESRKGRQLRENPSASLTFYWPPLLEQVHVEGRVEPVTAQEADAYWATRPRGSQLGAWASRQSETLASRRELIRRFAEHLVRNAGRPVPRPDFWSGFRLRPERIEFWKAKPRRLHERILWELADGAWTSRRLNP